MSLSMKEFFSIAVCTNLERGDMLECNNIFEQFMEEKFILRLTVN